MTKVDLSDMQAASEMYLAIDRAAGVPLIESEEAGLIYKLGFAAGQQHMMNKWKESLEVTK